ncbi:MAG TPA: hypothetical protein VK559_08875 [Ferruginibacter sp.]|nr:hypothetical protein [Ferruginibacter sp.]
MKKLLLYTACLGLVLFCGSCKKIDDLLTFTISNQTSFTIPSGGAISLPFDVPDPNNTSNSSEAFSNNNTDANHVKNIYLKNLQLKITNPGGQNFNFLQSITIYISTDSSNEIELATLSSIPQNVDSINLIPTSAALDVYVKSSTYNLRTQITTNEILTQDVTVEADSKFQVTAKL